MNPSLSKKIRIISLFAIVMVVMQHASCLPADTENVTVAEKIDFFIQHFFSFQLCKCAVPLFFSISGFLFFHGLRGTVREFLEKYRKRFFTLLLPYLIWSFAHILIRFLLGQSDTLHPYSGITFDSSFGPGEFLYRLLFDPVEYHLWFLRDLIAMVFLSPILYYSLRYAAFLTLPVLCYLCTFGIHPCDFGVFVLGSCSLFFFSLGGFLAMRFDGMALFGQSEKSATTLSSFPKKRLGKFPVFLCLLLWCGVSAYNAYVPIQNAKEAGPLLTRLACFAGMVAIWRGYDLFALFKTEFPVFLLGYTFFIYLFHEPLLDLVKKLIISVLNDSPLSREIAYWPGTIFTLFLCFVVGVFLKKCFPGFYRVITGNR